MSISQKFQLYDHPSQMEPLLPSEHRMAPLLESAHDLIRKADRLSGWCPPGALPGLRSLLRSMNSYYPKSGNYPAAMIRSGGSHGGSGRVIFATT